MIIKKRVIIGCRESVFLTLGDKKKEFIARIDTGARTSSLDMQLAVELSHSKILKTRVIKSASGVGLRPIIEVTIILAGKKIISNFTLADRSHMKYKILIGRNIIRKEKFLIDPLKKLHKKPIVVNNI
ncbi:hypothetical protein FP803_01680 [Candidatus Woesearchaeota archaeon]|nr:hypothetical protein [Candidatus Woesearchaeota archaeon]